MGGFCIQCGEALVRKPDIDGVERSTCPSCGWVFYRNPVPAVAGIATVGDKIVFVRRKYNPRAGYWCLPGGFEEYSESPEEAVVREMWEETGLKVKVSRLREVLFVDDDSFKHLVIVFYEVEVMGGELRPGDDALEVGLFSLDDLPKDLAFTSHRIVLDNLRKERGS
ncbi:MAG: NUDIX domain-containing protein [bacterium]